MSRKKLIVGKIVGVLCCLLISIACFGESVKQFRDGDVVCFLGDSITHNGRCQYYIFEYYVSRYPGRKMTFYNCGISGDTATRALSRLDWDLLDKKPNKTTIMLGMNDVGRGYYGKKKPDEKNLKMRASRISQYKKSMEKIADKLKKNNIEIIYLTPSPYDQTAKIKMQNLFGVNGALGECAEFCREEEKRNKSWLVDFYKPMTELNQKQQKVNPEFTLIGRDRVHPGKTGHFVMAYLFLKAQKVPGVVSSVKLEYKNGTLITEDNCRITNIKKEKKCLAFDCLEKSLPMPVSMGYKGADKLVPVTKDLNNETISVTGLLEGNYELLIDGKKFIKADAKVWEGGVNIATLPTPMQVQAAKVHNLVIEKQKLEARIRYLRKLEIIMKSRKVDYKNPEDRENFFEKFLEDMKGKKYARYYNNVVKSYRENKPKEKELLNKIKKLNNDIYKEAQPQLHHFELKSI